MKRITAMMLAAAASLGLAFASTGVLAQKAEATKDTKKVEAPKADTKKADAPKVDAPKVELMDVNSASEKELATLKGIGEVRAKDIVKHRPYKGKDEIVTKAKVPKSVYEGIKDQIIAKQDTMKKDDAKKPPEEKKAAEPAKKPAEPAKKPAEPAKKP